MKFAEISGNSIDLGDNKETEWPSLPKSHSCDCVKEEPSKSVSDGIQGKAIVKKSTAKLVQYVRPESQRTQRKDEKAVAVMKEEFEAMKLTECEKDVTQKEDFLPDYLKKPYDRDEMRREQTKSTDSQYQEYQSYSYQHNPREQHQRVQRPEYSGYGFRRDSRRFQDAKRTQQNYSTRPASYQKSKEPRKSDTDSDTENDLDTEDQVEVNYRNFSGLELQTKIDEILKRSIFKRKLKAKRDKNLAKHLIIKFIRKRRSEEGISLGGRDINSLANLIQSGFVGDNRGIFLYAIFLFFGKDVFNLDRSASSSDSSDSNPKPQHNLFDISEIQDSMAEWRKQGMEYVYIRDAFELLVQCEDKCDEKIVREHGDLFELRYKYKMLEGLMFFYDKS